MQWNVPDRTDHYLMQIATAINQTNARNPRQIKLKDHLINFSLKKRKEGQKRRRKVVMPNGKEVDLTNVEARVSRSKWVGIVGGKIRTLLPEQAVGLSVVERLRAGNQMQGEP
jgi:hypothetical protein